MRREERKRGKRRRPGMCRLDCMDTQRNAYMGKRGGGETSGEREREREKRENEMDHWRSSAKKKRKIWTMQREGRTNEKEEECGTRESRERRERR